MADKRFPSPVFGDLGEQTMLDGIPFGSSSRVVSDGDGDAKLVTQLGLEFCFPGPGTAIVAATRVGKNQEFGSSAMETSPLMFPPGGDGVGGEGRRVVRDANADRSAVVWRIVNAIGDAHSTGVRSEVVIVNQYRRSIPFGA